MKFNFKDILRLRGEYLSLLLLIMILLYTIGQIFITYRTLRRSISVPNPPNLDLERLRTPLVVANNTKRKRQLPAGLRHDPDIDNGYNIVQRWCNPERLKRQARFGNSVEKCRKIINYILKRTSTSTSTAMENRNNLENGETTHNRNNKNNHNDNNKDNTSTKTKLFHITKSDHLDFNIKNDDDNNFENNEDDKGKNKDDHHRNIVRKSFNTKLEQNPESESEDDNPYGYTPQDLEVIVFPKTEIDTNSYFQQRNEIISKIPSHIVMHNKDLCRLSKDGKKRPYLLVIVPTVLDHSEDRLAIRDTWGSVATNGGKWGNFTLSRDVRLLFLLGSSEYTSEQITEIGYEADVYGDILVSDFVDSYRNLSIKVAVGLAWAHKFCEGVDHVIKVDEDTFLFVPKLISLLKLTETRFNKFIMGNSHLDEEPLVVRDGKWAVDVQQYPLSFYPRYTVGHSYVISGQAIEPILSAFLRTPTIAPEDALFAGILPVMTDVVRLNHSSIASIRRDESECDVARGDFVSVTSCCNSHHRLIFESMLERRCRTFTMEMIWTVGCPFPPKKKQIGGGLDVYL